MAGATGNLQVWFGDIQYGFPCVEALFDEALKILSQTQSRQDWTQFRHIRWNRGSIEILQRYPSSFSCILGRGDQLLKQHVMVEVRFAHAPLVFAAEFSERPALTPAACIQLLYGILVQTSPHQSS